MKILEKVKYKYWQENDFWLGYLEEFPDYMTQGTSLENLQENLTDLYKDLTNGKISSVRRIGELDVK